METTIDLLNDLIDPLSFFLFHRKPNATFPRETFQGFVFHKKKNQTYKTNNKQTWLGTNGQYRPLNLRFFDTGMPTIILTDDLNCGVF